MKLILSFKCKKYEEGWKKAKLVSWINERLYN